MIEAGEPGKVACDFATFPREFVSYKWYKPLLVALLAVVFMVAFTLVLRYFWSAYDWQMR